MLPRRLSGGATDADRARAFALLARVGLSRPRQAIESMSRGEMQRVAIARALLREPAVLVADEPTASLDADSGALVAELLLELARESGATLIVVSHDSRLVERLPRRLAFAAGAIISDSIANEDLVQASRAVPGVAVVPASRSGIGPEAA